MFGFFFLFFYYVSSLRYLRLAENVKPRRFYSPRRVSPDWTAHGDYQLNDSAREFQDFNALHAHTHTAVCIFRYEKTGDQYFFFFIYSKNLLCWIQIWINLYRLTAFQEQYYCSFDGVFIRTKSVKCSNTVYLWPTSRLLTHSLIRWLIRLFDVDIRHIGRTSSGSTFMRDQWVTQRD